MSSMLQGSDCSDCSLLTVCPIIMTSPVLLCFGFKLTLTFLFWTELQLVVVHLLLPIPKASDGSYRDTTVSSRLQDWSASKHRYIRQGLLFVCLLSISFLFINITQKSQCAPMWLILLQSLYIDTCGLSESIQHLWAIHTQSKTSPSIHVEKTKTIHRVEMNVCDVQASLNTYVP